MKVLFFLEDFIFKIDNFRSIIFNCCFLLFSFISVSCFANENFSPPPPPPPSNNNCANAINVLVNGPIVSGITQGATLEPGELTDCAIAGSTQSVWYYFTATANNISVSLTSTSGGCYFSSAIWPASSGCPAATGCHSLSCQSASGGPNTTVHDLTNLTIGSNYYIQILYNPGGVCGVSAGFDIAITTTIPANPSNPPLFLPAQVQLELRVFLVRLQQHGRNY